MKNNIILSISIFLILLSVINIAYAQDEDPQVGVPFNLIRSCYLNNTWCPSGTICNATIVQGDILILDNQEMTNQGSYHNISTTFTNPGNARAMFSCCLGNQCGSETIELRVTTTGDTYAIWITLILLISAIATLILGMWSSNEAFGYLSGILFLMAGVFIMIYGFGDIANLYTRALALSAIAFGIIITISAAYETFFSEHQELITNHSNSEDE